MVVTLVFSLLRAASDPSGTITHEDVPGCTPATSTHCGYLGVEARWPAYASQTLPPVPARRTGEDDFELALQRKYAAAVELSAAYDVVARAGNDVWAARAACRVGETWLAYAHALVDAPGATEAERQAAIVHQARAHRLLDVAIDRHFEPGANAIADLRRCADEFNAPVPAAPVALPALVPINAETPSRCAGSTTDECRFIALERRWPSYAAIPDLTEKTGVKLKIGIDFVRVDGMARERNVLAKDFVELSASTKGTWSVAAGCRAAEVLLAYAAFMRFDDDVAPEYPPVAERRLKSGFYDPMLSMTTFGVEEQAAQQIDRVIAQADREHVDSPYLSRCRAELAATRLPP